jgi:hypothetical protein
VRDSDEEEDNTLLFNNFKLMWRGSVTYEVVEVGESSCNPGEEGRKGS